MNAKQMIKKFKSKTPKKWKLMQRIVIAIGSGMVLLTMYPEHFAYLPEAVTKTISGCALLSAILIQFKSEENGEPTDQSDIPAN